MFDKPGPCTENSPPGGIFRSEYLAFEFADGSSLALQIENRGNSFLAWSSEQGEKLPKRVHEAAEKTRVSANLNPPVSAAEKGRRGKPQAAVEAS